MKKLAIIVLTMLLTASCGTRPINNVENHPVPLTAQQLPLERIEALIIAAGQNRAWQFQRQAPGYLTATQTQPKYSATVDIRFSQQAYSIMLRSSTGLREKDGSIHRRYNSWIRSLQRDIDASLANDAVLRR